MDPSMTILLTATNEIVRTTVGFLRGRTDQAAPNPGPEPLTDFDYVREIDLQSNQVLNNYPVPITLDISNVNVDGSDLRITDLNLNYLPIWIEEWNLGSGKVWVKVPVIANGTTGLLLHYGNVNAVSVSDGKQVFDVFEDWSDESVLHGDIQSPTASIGGTRTLSPVVTRELGTWKETIKEPGQVIYDPTAPINERYKFYYSGNNPSMLESAGVAFAANPEGPYTDYVNNPCIPGCEDPYILVVGSTWHAWGESKPGGSSIWHWTSSDGLTWVKDSVDMTPQEVYEDSFIASPCVWYENGQFFMLYEAVNASNVITIALARSNDGSVWAREPTNPIIASSGEAPVVDEIVKIDNTYYMIEHNVPYRLRIWTTNVAPELWDDASWVVGRVIDSYGYWMMSVHNTNNKLWVFGHEFGDNFYILPIWDNSSPGGWRVSRAGQAGDSVNPMFVQNNELHLKPEGNQTGGIYVWTADENIVANFAVGIRRKLDPTNRDARRSSVSIGTGHVGPSSNVTAFQGHENGHVFYLGNVTENGGEIRRMTSGVIGSTNLGAGTFPQEEIANRWGVYEYRMLANGAGQWVLDGSIRAIFNDTTYIADAKSIAISQGFSATSSGAETIIDWVYVRPFYGIEPTVTVGLEQTAN
jgi:hypothetical protein